MINGIHSGRVQIGSSASTPITENVDVTIQRTDKQHGTQLSANNNRIAQQGAPIDDIKVDKLRSDISDGAYGLKPARIAEAIMGFHNIGEH